MKGDTPVADDAGMHLTKTKMEYNMKTISYSLMAITTMFMVMSGLLIILGILVYSYYHGFSFFYDTSKVGWIMTPSVLCMFTGLALMLVSIFGFFGGLKLSTCMVNIYAFIMSLLFIIKLVVVILAFTMDDEELMRHIEIPAWGGSDPEVQFEVDALQFYFSCCGSDSYLEYISMTFGENQTTVQGIIALDGWTPVYTDLPATCCTPYDPLHCDRISGIGCKEALLTSFLQNSIAIGILCVFVMFINLLGVIFALLLARYIRKLKSARALVTWNIKEQMIMAREAEEKRKNEPVPDNIDHYTSSKA